MVTFFIFFFLACFLACFLAFFLGSENLLLAFVCHRLHMVFILANGLAQQAGHRARHRFVPSTRNRIERFWAEVNLRVNLPVKLMLVHMENILNILDIGNVHHINAV
tara:strand:+ start:827 stop:1147 length:321 start_codon:yes stop_codon:yes gene_type:complete